MLRWLLLPLLIALLGTTLWCRFKPLPSELGRTFPWRDAQQTQLLWDITTHPPQQKANLDQEIMPQLYTLISASRQLLLLDMFLFNQWLGDMEAPPGPDISRQLTQQLIKHQKKHPDCRIVFITDPINRVYGGQANPLLQQLQEAGIEVVLTDLSRLRASNPVYSSLFYTLLRPLSVFKGPQLENPFGQGQVPLQSYLKLLHFRANHRKVAVADNGQGQLQALVTSANPHTGSSAHTNIGLRFSGPAAWDVLSSEKAILDFSAPRLDPLPVTETAPQPQDTAAPRLRLLTEKAIGRQLLHAIDQTRTGDQIHLLMFYLSHRQIIKALKQAQSRGVQVRLVLDPNHNAFGRLKDGLPNRAVATELHNHGIDVRWYNTGEEQMHAKLVHIQYAHKANTAIFGSANLTRRNIDNLNLETNIQLEAAKDYPAMKQIRQQWQSIWQDPEGLYTRPYSSQQPASTWEQWRYRLQEMTGMGTF